MGLLKALDPLTGETNGIFVFSGLVGRKHSPPRAAYLHGDEDGSLIALDARTGKNLWHFNTGARLVAARSRTW